jgi:hypothetical protein
MFKVSHVTAYLFLQVGQLIKIPLECDAISNELVRSWLNVEAL